MTGVFVPAGTPKPIVDLLQKEIAAIVNAPDMKARLLEAGVEAEGNSQADFAAYVRAEVAKWRKVIEDAESRRSIARDLATASPRSRPGARACPRARSRCRR